METFDFTLRDFDSSGNYFNAASRVGAPVVFISSGKTSQVTNQFDGGNQNAVKAEYAITLNPQSGNHHVEEDVLVTNARLVRAITSAADDARRSTPDIKGVTVGGVLVEKATSNGKAYELDPFPPEHRQGVSTMLAAMNAAGALRASPQSYGDPPTAGNDGLAGGGVPAPPAVMPPANPQSAEVPF